VGKAASNESAEGEEEGENAGGAGKAKAKEDEADEVRPSRGPLKPVN